MKYEWNKRRVRRDSAESEIILLLQHCCNKFISLYFKTSHYLYCINSFNE